MMKYGETINVWNDVEWKSKRIFLFKNSKGKYCCLFEDDSIEDFEEGKVKFYAWESGEEIPYKDRQADWVKKVGLEVGDTIRVTKNWEKDDFGFDSSGVSEDAVGDTYEVKRINSGRIMTVRWDFPYFAIEKVEEVEKAYILQTFPKDHDSTIRKKVWQQKDSYTTILEITTNGFFTLIDGEVEFLSWDEGFKEWEWFDESIFGVELC